MDQTALTNNFINLNAIVQKREDLLKGKISQLQVKPKIVNILVGNDQSSMDLIHLKQRKAAELGIIFDYMRFPESELFENVALTIFKLNQDPTIHGITVELPLPDIFLKDRKIVDLIQRIDPKKDVEGLTEKSTFLPGIVRAINILVEEENIVVKGKFSVVLGTDTFVGKPVASEMRKKGALVATVNPNTLNMDQVTERADLIITTEPMSAKLTGEMVKNQVIIIDAAETVDKLSLLQKAAKITPEGGVETVAIMSLMENVIAAVESH